MSTDRKDELDKEEEQEEQSTLKRGDRIVVYSATLFINDDEEGWIEFIQRGMRTRVALTFEPRNPPQPQLKFTPMDGYIELKLLGWNAPIAYSAIKPTPIGSYENRELSVALCNSRLGETNKLEIQFYEEVIDKGC
ncbi:MAG: hypothetical protein ACTSWQ_08035 [Candidatus Thorarchaeota archaeon]